MRQTRVQEPIVVYTAIAGNYDLLKKQPERLRRAARFVAFLDGQTLRSQLPEPPLRASVPGPETWLGWELRRMRRRAKDPCRLAKIYKVMPHLFFPDAQYSFWIDGSVALVSRRTIEGLIDRYLDGVDLCVFRHPFRSCIYREAEVCKRLKLDRSPLIDRQMARYRAAGYPENAGLVEATVLLRRHSPRVREFNELWWREIESGSRRDQLSFNFAAWKAGLSFGFFPGKVAAGNGLAIRHHHRDFFRPMRTSKKSSSFAIRA